MFTGLIEAIGTVLEVGRSEAGVEVRIDAPWTNLADGESIAVNGVCLTILAKGDGWFSVGAMTPTVERTCIADWTEGRRVNLERAMRADARIGGHIVQGHVDGVAEVTAVERIDDALLADVSLPAGLAETLVLHGSVAVDGVSLTVNRLEGDKLQVAIIDYTLRHTALGTLGPGSKVHIETDIIGKYVRRLTEPYLNR